MNYLLDTHICIWAIAEQDKLSARVKQLLQDPDNFFLVSRISFLEIAIKMKVGKLPDFKTSLPEFIKSVYQSGYEVLSVKDEHMGAYGSIDFVESHRDPFDRYLIAATKFENLAIITKDEKFQLYSKTIQVIW
jgi:PIN domain nuclease of toxin-antitoxin system